MRLIGQGEAEAQGFLEALKKKMLGEAMASSYCFLNSRFSSSFCSAVGILLI